YAPSGVEDYETVAYSGTGVPLWTNRYSQGSHATATAIAMDRVGNVFVTGFTSGGNDGYATVAYSGAGVPLWTNRYDGPAGVNNEAHAIAVDSSGNVYVTGTFNDGVNGDYATIKYASSFWPVPLTIAPDGSSGYFLRFQGIPGSVYQLQRATSLTGPWTTS